MGWFSSNKKDSTLNWEHLSSSTNWNNLISSDDWVIIFKHSPRCGISSMALRQFEKEWLETNNVRLCMVDVVKDRGFSQEIAKLTDVIHQSPQLILIKNGKVLHHASHHQIEVKNVLQIIKE
ncbi:MAG: bacillithiol system redox-active protein YtxJ [Crocinitomicaceae bacterium]|nr:bacillithiol system redox-active protein YtxJ [Crocinitomicaceae bacterium]